MLLSHSELWKVCLEYISRPCTVVLGAITTALYYLWGREGQVSPTAGHELAAFGGTVYRLIQHVVPLFSAHPSLPPSP